MYYSTGEVYTAAVRETRNSLEKFRDIVLVRSDAMAIFAAKSFSENGVDFAGGLSRGPKEEKKQEQNRHDIIRKTNEQNALIFIATSSTSFLGKRFCSHSKHQPLRFPLPQRRCRSKGLLPLLQPHLYKCNCCRCYFHLLRTRTQGFRGRLLNIYTRYIDRRFRARQPLLVYKPFKHCNAQKPKKES